MGRFNDALNALLGKKTEVYIDDCALIGTIETIAIHELALSVCIKIIADAISKCEFKTYSNGAEKKGDEYHLWNVSPNRNQNKYDFLRDIVPELLKNGESVVIERNTGYGTELLKAESYNKEVFSTAYDKFSNVITRGNKEWSHTFSSNEVLCFKYSNQKISQLMQSVDVMYQNLIKYATSGYKMSNTSKYKFTYETIPPADTEERKAFDKLMQTEIKTWLQELIAILPLGKGYDVEAIKQEKGSSTYTDIASMIDKIFAMYFHAFGIPTQFYTSSADGMDDANKQLLTMAILPVIECMQAEINKKRYTKEEFMRGDFIELDTNHILYRDAFELATSIDKLISSGAETINSIKHRLREPEIKEEFANIHWMTKNYAPAKDVAMPLNNT